MFLFPGVRNRTDGPTVIVLYLKRQRSLWPFSWKEKEEQLQFSLRCIGTKHLLHYLALRGFYIRERAS